MYYYKCRRCNYVSKYKIDIQRHLDKKFICGIKDKTNTKSDIQLKIESLEKIVVDFDNNEHNILENNSFICPTCEKSFHNKSNLNKHVKKNFCEKSEIDSIKTNIINSNNIGVQNVENIGVKNVQNVGVQNIININISGIRGFDEDWNISNITNEIKEKIFLSNSKFTNTLKNIFENNENLNVILHDDSTGFVYKIKNNDYEVMPVKNILDESMDKLYKHLRDFFTNIITNNSNDIRVDILENELKEVDKKYTEYKESVCIKQMANDYLSKLFEENKIGAINNYKKVKSVDKDIENSDENALNY